MSRGSMQYRSYATGRHTTLTRKRPRKFTKALLVLVVLVLFGGATAYGLAHKNKDAASSGGKTSLSTDTTGNSQKTISAKTLPKPAAKAAVAQTSSCSGNALSQLALVSISKRHLWACDGTKQVYDSAVVTGMENLPADLTPTGTYHIYAKQTNLYLKGSDSTGSWNDYVYYWMPFLDNQYGQYGFHDATWRKPDAFGNISPYSSQASHGCVELPLTTAKWLYNWAQVGTTVKIEA